MNLSKPLDLSRETLTNNKSGCPLGMVELMRKRKDLVVVKSFGTWIKLPGRKKQTRARDNVLVCHPPSPDLEAQTGCRYFVKWRVPVKGKRYGLIASGTPD